MGTKSQTCRRIYHHARVPEPDYIHRSHKPLTDRMDPLTWNWGEQLWTVNCLRIHFVFINYKGLGQFLAGGTLVFLLKHMNMNYSYFFYYSPYLKINALIVKFLLNSNHNFRNSRVLPFEAHGGDSTIKTWLHGVEYIKQFLQSVFYTLELLILLN